MPDPSARGRFISLEGVDGAGKSTHASWLVEAIAARGHRVVQTREPGGTALGEALRDIVLARTMTHETEALLMFAARAEHVATLIAPALGRGDWVLCDRFTDATYAYQGGGHGVSRDLLRALERHVQQGCSPDVTLLFDVPAEVSRSRLERAIGKGRALDKFEQEAESFFERVRAAYLERAAAEPGRFRIVDSTRPIDEVRSALASIVAAL